MRFVLTVLLLIAVIAAGCTMVPDEQAAHDPAAIRDAYLIAHGMAKGYSEREDADPQVLAQLRTLDQQAAHAVGALVEGESGSPDDTARAVAALTDYAARQTPASP
jgi:hypothetical protein